MENLNEAKVVEKMCKKYCKRRKFILLLIKICIDNDIKNTENYIEKYLLGVSNSVSTNNKTDTITAEINAI